MIKDSIDFDYALSQINRELNKDVFTQGDILDSESFNTTFKNIESNLNTLYENTRNLENMIKYCKTFLSVKIDQYSKETKAILDLIEDVRDINKNMAYIDYPVSLVTQNKTYKDRDNSTLPMCRIQNGKVILGNVNTEYINLDNSNSRKSISIPYKENLQSLGTSEAYRVTYIEDSTHQNGLLEQITIHFASPVTINNIDLQTSNCEIKNLVYKYINGTQEQQSEYITGYTSKKLVTSLTFDLVCTNYIHTIYKINKDKMTDNTWDNIKEYEYNDLINATTQIEVDELIEIIRGDDVISFASDDNKNVKNVESINKYTYRFGLDYLNLSYVEQYNESCFMSDEIHVGRFNSNEYLNINTEFSSLESTSIEFYIVDGNKEVPILPLSLDKIKNEKIFTGMNLRFDQGYDDDYAIRKDGYVINMSLDDAISQMTGNYSVDYTPNATTCYSYTPINTSIKVKAILRKYNDFAEMPYIESIKIRKFGGAAPWIEEL